MSTSKGAPPRFRAMVKARTDHNIHVVGVEGDEGHEAIIPLDRVRSYEKRPILVGGTGDVRLYPGEPPLFRPDRRN